MIKIDNFAILKEETAGILKNSVGIVQKIENGIFSVFLLVKEKFWNCKIICWN